MLYEWEGKELMQRYGIPTPRGLSIFCVQDVGTALSHIGTSDVMVKVQVQGGGRGKGGGVKRARTPKQAEDACRELLSVPFQGKLVAGLLVEEHLEIRKEMYLAFTYDTAQKVVDRVNLIGAGLTGPVDPLVGFVAAMLTPTTMACTDLDYAAAVDVNNALGTFAADLYEFIEGVDSEVVSCTRATGAKNLAASLSITALAGGANGVATTASVQAALDAIRDLDTRHVVLMATAAGTADSFAELLEAHVKERAGKYERVGYFGTTTYATKKTDPGVDPGGLFQRTARRNYRGMVFTPQEVRDYDETGTPVWLPPYYTALLAAGCQAGRLNEASVIWATVDVLDVRDYPGAVSGTNWTVANDKEELLEYGCHILEKLPGTGLIRWAADQTCHLSDNNPIYSSQVANESSDLSIQNVRRVVEDLIGFTNVVVTEGRVKDAVDRELGRQVEAKEIKAYERQTIAVIPGGNYFDVSYNFQPAEATKWIVQRAHIRRLSAAA